jgi:hypothetical protein
MLRNIYFALSLLALTLAACGEAALTVGEEQAFASVCDQANKGQRVAVQGYLRLPESFSGDLSVVLRMYENDDFRGAPIGVQIRLGSEANQVEQVPLNTAMRSQSPSADGRGRFWDESESLRQGVFSDR